MKNFPLISTMLAISFMLGSLANGQTPAPAAASKADAAQAEAGEPRANTGADSPGSVVPAQRAAEPAATGAPAAASKGGKAKAGKGGKNAADRVDLDTTTVTGNRELPKVMYVVPWKRSDIGDLVGRPANSLLDEVLAPVDRNVFRREVQYYQALKPDSAPAAVSAPQGEK